MQELGTPGGSGIYCSRKINMYMDQHDKRKPILCQITPYGEWDNQTRARHGRSFNRSINTE